MGSKTIYAIFEMEEDYTIPYFKSIEDADKIMRTPNIM